MSKQHYLIVDTETTQTGLVADFGAVLCDRKGRVLSSCGVLVQGVYDSPQHPLFFTSDAAGIWSKQGQDKRYAAYNRMLQCGTRMLATVPAINAWLARARAYNPILTAYNLPFDLDKCKKTGIDLNGFDSFCLWAAACNRWAKSKAYRQFALDKHAFNAPTERGNMTYKTNAELMAAFVLGWPEMPPEPHTALEDALEYELPILRELLRSKRYTKKRLLSGFGAYNWRDYQVNENYSVL